MPPKAKDSAKGRGSAKGGGRASAKGATQPAVPVVPPRIPVYKSKHIPTSRNHEKALELQQKLKQVFNSYDRVNAGRLSTEDAEQAVRAAGLFINGSEDALAIFDSVQNTGDKTIAAAAAAKNNTAATATTDTTKTAGVPLDTFLPAVTKALVMRRYAPEPLPAVCKALDMFRNNNTGNIDWETLKQYLTSVGHTPLSEDEAAAMMEDFVDEKKLEFREQHWLREVFEQHKLSVAWLPANPMALLQQNPFTTAPS